MERSVAFLLENAGPVIQLRLHRDLLGDLSPSLESALRDEIEQLPLVGLLKTYVRPNGYIGTGMHSWDHWRGEVLHHTPLEDGENAARLLSQYCFPKDHPLVAGFMAALRDEESLRETFSYISPEKDRFEKRFRGLNNGNCLMALIYTLQALLGFGDDFEDLRAFQQIALEGFRQIRNAPSFHSLVRKRSQTRARYNYPFIEENAFFPNSLTLTMLAYTQSWRTSENVQMLAEAINHLNHMMDPENNLHVRIAGKSIVPFFALVRPIRPFKPEVIDTILYRRVLSEIAMLGVGKQVDVLRETAEQIRLATDERGVLRMRFDLPHNRRYSPKALEYPWPYSDLKLEPGRDQRSIDCDLTFWAVELMHLINKETPQSV